ncbi:hypothetical protein Emed_006909 [Eimeria media]
MNLTTLGSPPRGPPSSPAPSQKNFSRLASAPVDRKGMPVSEGSPLRDSGRWASSEGFGAQEIHTATVVLINNPRSRDSFRFAVAGVLTLYPPIAQLIGGTEELAIPLAPSRGSTGNKQQLHCLHYTVTSGSPCHIENLENFSVEELLHSLSKDSTPESASPKTGAASAVNQHNLNSNPNSNNNSSSSSSNSNSVLYKDVPLRPSQVSSNEATQDYYNAETTAGPAWDIEGILGLKPEGPQPGKPSQGAARKAHAGNPSQTADALSAQEVAAQAGEESGAPPQRGPSAEQVASLAEAKLANARLETELQQVRHELLLLRRRMQCESAALQAQHEAKVAEERAAWETEKQKLLFKTQTLQATVDQTLARYEEDVKLLGQARGSVLQQQQLEQQQQQQQLQLQLQQALQAERDHWSARLQAANDEWRRRLEDDRRAAEAKLQHAQQAREGPAWHELHALILESKRSSDEFKQLIKGFQLQQQQQLMQKRGGAEGGETTLPCAACGQLADIGAAVAALQQQQQTLLLLAEETAKLREETEQRTKAASSKLTEQSLQLEGLHRSLLASRQQQQQLQQQQQQQLQQQQHFLEQQQQAFTHRQLEAAADATSRQLELDQACTSSKSLSSQSRERELARREAQLNGATALQEKQHRVREQHLKTAETHLLKLQGELQKERQAHATTSDPRLLQELAETAMALEEKRRALRCCFEEIEAQKIAVEGRAAKASADAESAAAEAQKARTLQQENMQAKEVLQQLRRRAKDAEKQQQEQQDVIKCLVKEVESSRLELLRMQQSHSSRVYMNRLGGMLLPYSSRSLMLGNPKPQNSLLGHPRSLTPMMTSQSLLRWNSSTGSRYLVAGTGSTAPAAATANTPSSAYPWWYNNSKRFQSLYRQTEGNVGLDLLQRSTASSFLERQRDARRQPKAFGNLEKQSSCMRPHGVHTQPPSPQPGSNTFTKPPLESGVSSVEQVWHHNKHAQQERHQQDLTFGLTSYDVKAQPELLSPLLRLV